MKIRQHNILSEALNDQRVRLAFLSVQELEAFVDTAMYKQMPVLPITPQRARSQARNPRAHPDDLALTLVYLGDELVGYAGTLPDELWTSSEKLRAAWLSCLWVAPKMRGRGIAQQLVAAVAERWNGQILLAEFAPHTRSMYERTGMFREGWPMVGFRGYLRPDFARLLSARGGFWQKIKPLLHAADALLAVPNALRLRFHLTKMPDRIRYIQAVDAPMGAFVAARQAHELTHPDQTLLNWWLQTPWVLSAPTRDEVAERYHFTSIAREFSSLALQWIDERGNPLGLLVLTLRDGHLRVPFAYFDDAQAATAAQILFAHALRLNARMLTCYEPRLVAFCRQNRTPFFWQRTLQRTFFMTHTLADKVGPEEVAMQDGAGDLGFT